MYTLRFTKILDKLCPIKSIQVRKNYTPWRNDDITHHENVLKIAKEVAKQSKARDDQTRVQTIAKELRRKYRSAEDKWRKLQVQ